MRFEKHAPDTFWIVRRCAPTGSRFAQDFGHLSVHR